MGEGEVGLPGSHATVAGAEKGSAGCVANCRLTCNSIACATFAPLSSNATPIALHSHQASNPSTQKRTRVRTPCRGVRTPGRDTYPAQRRKTSHKSSV